MTTVNVNDAIAVFQQSMQDYHREDSVDAVMDNPYDPESFSHLLYVKNWIDTVQWHFEDIIRDPHIKAHEALKLKRRIDASNQMRTDLVENIDAWFLKSFREVTPDPGATLNTETPAWAFDRLSILELKIFHMREEAERESADAAHREACRAKLDVLLVQRTDLSGAIDQLLADISAGKKVMKLYKQMKMYNDETLNPILYKQNKA